MKVISKIVEYDRLWLPDEAKKRMILGGLIPGLPAINSDVLIGIEVEVENVTRGLDHPLIGNIWLTKDDGSLRNHGIELVTRGAMPANLVPAALGALYKILRDTNPNHEFSHRCGFHYHVNIRDLTPEQLVTFLLLYHIAEPLLFRFCSPERAASNFCVPSQDTNSFYQAVATLYNACLNDNVNSDTMVNFGQLFGGKYAALGVFRLIDLGTVEFRHMEGTPDLTRLVRWISFGVALREAAERYDFDTLAKKLSLLNTTSAYDVFLRDIFKDNFNFLYMGEQDIPLMSLAVANAKQIMVSHHLPPNIKTLFDSPLGDHLISTLNSNRNNRRAKSAAQVARAAPAGAVFGERLRARAGEYLNHDNNNGWFVEAGARYEPEPDFPRPDDEDEDDDDVRVREGG